MLVTENSEMHFIRIEFSIRCSSCILYLSYFVCKKKPRWHDYMFINPVVCSYNLSFKFNLFTSFRWKLSQNAGRFPFKVSTNSTLFVRELHSNNVHYTERERERYGCSTTSKSSVIEIVLPLKLVDMKNLYTQSPNLVFIAQCDKLIIQRSVSLVMQF